MGWSCCSNGPATATKRILIPKAVGSSRRRKRRRRRPKMSWKDGVDNDVKALRERN
jgi:hypothetical protein